MPTKLDILRAFISTPKPEDFTVIDYAILTCLLCDGLGPLRIAHLTIAQRIGSTSKTVQRSIARLVKSGVIVKVSGKRQKNANVYTVQLAALPSPPEFKKIVISDEAFKLADDYMVLLRRDHGKVKGRKSGRSYSRKLPRGWRNRWAFVLQKQLDAPHSAKYLRELFAWVSQRFPKEFVIGPQGWSHRVPALEQRPAPALVEKTEVRKVKAKPAHVEAIPLNEISCPPWAEFDPSERLGKRWAARRGIERGLTALEHAELQRLNREHVSAIQ